MKKNIKGKIVLFLVLLFAHAHVQAANFYVSKTGAGAKNGYDWSNAWSLNGINWALVVPGSTLYIDGGPSNQSVTYTEMWSVGASGTAAQPITIAIDATNTSHNGVAVFDFDTCGDQCLSNAIDISGRSYLTINGNVNGENHIAIKNLRNIMDRFKAVGIVDNSGFTTGVIVDHVLFDNINMAIKLNSATKVKFKNSTLSRVRGDAAIQMTGSSGGWDTNLIHNNTVELLYYTGTNPNYLGPDGFQIGNGFSVFNNTFRVSSTTLLTSNQHPDTIQAIGHYIKIYGNEFINVGDSDIDYGGGYDTAAPNPYGDLWIYNNVFRIETPLDPYPEYIRIYGNSSYRVASFTNIKIFNNTFADHNASAVYGNIYFGTYGGTNPTATGVEIKNNIFMNAGSGSTLSIINIDHSTAFTASSFSFDGNVYHNENPATPPYVRGTLATDWVAANEPNGKVAKPTFESYSPFSASNNFQLSPDDTVAMNAGVSLATYFNTDKTGVTTRPQGSAWDIGAYEFGGPVIPKLTVNKNGLGTGTVTGTANSAQIINCGSDCDQQFPQDTSTSVTVTATPQDANSSFAGWTVNGSPITCPGTGACTVNVSGSVSITATFNIQSCTAQRQGTVDPVNGLTFEAEAGCIEAPFSRTTVGTLTYVSQSETTGPNPLAGGKASYRFTIPQGPDGDYLINAKVNTSNATNPKGSDSFYVNVDAEPTAPDMVWDIIPLTCDSATPPNCTIQERTVNWRGDRDVNAPDYVPQFFPKTFRLTPGEYTLIIRGREPDALIDSISIIKQTGPPTVSATLTIVKVGNGTVTGTVSGSPVINCDNSNTDCAQTFQNTTTQVLLAVTPGTDATFSHWSIPGCPGTGPCTVTITEDTTITATFNGGTDTTPPTVALIFPDSGSTLSGATGLLATAQDNVGISSVQFFLDGNILGPLLTSAPYFFLWDTRGVSNGSHALSARATDSSNKSATSPLVVVTMNNGSTGSSHTLSVTKLGPGTVTSTPGGINCGSTCNASFNHGMSVALIAQASPGYVHTWGGACSGSLPICSLTLNADKPVTASFTPEGIALQSGFSPFKNKFNPAKGEFVTIPFSLNQAGQVTLTIYDRQGREVKVLWDGVSAGDTIRWDGKNEEGEIVASSIYILVLKTPEGTQTRKVVIIK